MGSSCKTSTYCGVLYCDDPTHEKAIYDIMKYYHHFVIKHCGEPTQDIETDSNGEQIVVTGKDHWHFLIFFPYSVDKKYICSRLGITENYIQSCSSRKSYLRYCTHYGDGYKHQYTIEDFYTNKPIVLESDLKGMRTREELQAELNSIIQNKNWIIGADDTYESYIGFIIKNGYFNLYRLASKMYDNLYISTVGKPIYWFNYNTDLNTLVNSLTGEVI